MNPRLRRQIARIGDLFQAAKPSLKSKDISGFLAERLPGRSPSSIEEELLSHLPLFDREEEEKLNAKALETAEKLGVEVQDQRVFDEICSQDKELGESMFALGLRNYQFHFIQLPFYDKVKQLLEIGKDKEFEAHYRQLSSVELFGLNAACIEDYTYSPALGYRSVLFHMLRHLHNITGEESSYETARIAYATFKDKKVLELGCGPGFFLYTLKQLGADVTGVELNKDVKKVPGLRIIEGDARKLPEIVNDEFDIVFSKDFITLAVTKHDAGDIMEGVFKIMKPGAFTFHSIDYRRTPEELYLKNIGQYCKTPEDLEKLKKGFSGLTDEGKEYILRRNIFNISLEHLEDIGFTRLGNYKLDVEENLSFALRK
ncbi:methyltransferase domain-containing protein [Candidatus Woesearchaeota archaeon]|nr:methyltransferase domain-containing protein [Candidatus Woesearchaeota archaeon]